MRKVACGLQPSTTTARAGQANTGGIRGKVRSICGAKVDATDGNDGKHTKGGIDYDRQNLIRGGSVVGYRSADVEMAVGLDNELAAFASCISHDDCQEGLRAYLGKRSPVWSSKKGAT